MLGMVLGSAIMLSLDVSRVILEPVRTARDTIPGFSQVSFLLPLARVPLSLSIILSPSPPLTVSVCLYFSLVLVVYFICGLVLLNICFVF